MFKIKIVGKYFKKYKLIVASDSSDFVTSDLETLFQIMNFYMNIKSPSDRDIVIHNYLMMKGGKK